MPTSTRRMAAASSDESPQGNRQTTTIEGAMTTSNRVGSEGSSSSSLPGSRRKRSEGDLGSSNRDPPQDAVERGNGASSPLSSSRSNYRATATEAALSTSRASPAPLPPQAHLFSPPAYKVRLSYYEYCVEETSSSRCVVLEDPACTCQRGFSSLPL
jgi:hypothetical protein